MPACSSLWSLWFCIKNYCDGSPVMARNTSFLGREWYKVCFTAFLWHIGADLSWKWGTRLLWAGPLWWQKDPFSGLCLMFLLPHMCSSLSIFELEMEMNLPRRDLTGFHLSLKPGEQLSCWGCQGLCHSINSLLLPPSWE